MKLSFDFDGTLTRKDVQAFAKRLIDDGHEVWIVTSRFDDVEGLAKNWNWIPTQNLGLFKVAEELGIPESRIKFTNMIPKIEFLLGKGFAFHLDDDESELAFSFGIFGSFLCHYQEILNLNKGLNLMLDEQNHWIYC